MTVVGFHASHEQVSHEVHLSFASDDDTALQIAHDQWRTDVLAPPFCWELDVTTPAAAA